MTFDPQHDYEDEDHAKARLGGRLREDCAGPCPACLAASVGQGQDAKILVPTMRAVNGERVFTGKWLHGFQLRTQLKIRRDFLDQLKQTLAGHAMVER